MQTVREFISKYLEKEKPVTTWNIQKYIEKIPAQLLHGKKSDKAPNIKNSGKENFSSPPPNNFLQGKFPQTEYLELLIYI
jgi:hypothetical protein